MVDLNSFISSRFHDQTTPVFKDSIVSNQEHHTKEQLIHHGVMHDIAEQSKTDLNFLDLPPFPEDVPTAPLLRISLSKLTIGDREEISKLWKACCELGFFYLDLRGVSNRHKNHPTSSALNVPTENVRQEVGRADSATGHNEHSAGAKDENIRNFEIDIDGEQLLQDAEDLFRVGKSVFDLPVEEKVKYDLKDQGSYFGYKGYGQGVIDAVGTKDRNEFYNVRNTLNVETSGADVSSRFRKTIS